MIIDIPDLPSTEICCHRAERLWVTVWIEITERQLTISGQDLGDVPKEWFGSDEFEYWYKFDEANTLKLLSTLSDGNTDPIAEFENRFSGLKGCEKLKEFCHAEGITYQYFSWVSHFDRD